MGAYATEVIRGAIQSVPGGLVEAATAYGMSGTQMLRRIVLPAMLPLAIPGLANLWLIVTKDTALLAVVGFEELATVTRQAAGSTRQYLVLFLSQFPSIPGLRESFLWPLLRDAFPYAILAFSVSVAGYQGEIFRGAFLSVPKGELEAARAFGMGPLTLLRRIWLPRAVRNVLTTLAGECVLTLKSTPLAATITVYDVFGIGSIIRQETYRVYEPLLVVAGIYFVITAVIVVLFRWLEGKATVR